MNRDCKGYLVDCKNPAVKGRLFCFTCAGRKSRNKKTQALESFERECEMLRSRITELEPELAHWKSVAMSLRISEIESRNQKPQQDPMLELSGAAEALLAFADQMSASATASCPSTPPQSEFDQPAAHGGAATVAYAAPSVTSEKSVGDKTSRLATAHAGATTSKRWQAEAISPLAATSHPPGSAESAALAAWHVPIQLLMPAVDLIHNAAPAAEADVHAAATANPAPATRTSITKRARQDIGMSPLHTTAKRRCCTIHSGNTE
ncbi:hypothetical protein HK105_208936 [Polyrhizophydium stewartii]|uniref:Uncharacterized protein n=1 Tax=Polyrhizophydium stewartii TaxID=2732419 RepID=A0ABR4MWE9_9FUNG